MTPPGLRLRALSLRWCSDRARRRLIDPALADFQAEHAAARRTGSGARVFRTLVAGYLALAKVLVIAACGDLRGEMTAWQPAERAGARAGGWIALIVVAVTTVLLEAQVLTGIDMSTWLAVYLLPSALPLSVPLGLAVAVAWTLYGAARTRKLAAAALVVATLASAAMFVNVTWLVPETNQAFREHLLAQLDPYRDPSTPLPRGINELTWSGARERLREARARADARETRELETLYYGKFAMSVTPVAIVALVVALAFRRPWTRAGLTSVALAVCAVNYALVMAAPFLSDFAIVPPIVLGWTPDAICGLAALLLAFGARSTAATAPAAGSTR